MNSMNIQRITKASMLIAVVALACGPVLAYKATWKSGGSGSVATGGAKAAGCAPASTAATLEFNNVRARVENGGNMWQNRASGNAFYYVPKSADEGIIGPSALYAGALWMGGLSPDNQLKLAAVQFRQDGNDYWPGPLSNTGDASVSPETCLAYDKIYRTRRVEAAQHEAYYNCSLDPECDLLTEFPDGYVTPTTFFEWPALGDPAQGQDLYIAPFQDYNGREFLNRMNRLCFHVCGVILPEAADVDAREPCPV